MAFKTSDTMRHMIEEWEGLVLDAAPDVVGVPTVGYGHTGTDVYNGMRITQAQADQLLSQDLGHFETKVSEMATNLNQQRFDALVSFSFNLGEGNLAKSTLLKLNNAGDFAAAAAEFGKWNHAGGRVFAGLTRRRAGEAQMYLSGGTAAGDQTPPTHVYDPGSGGFGSGGVVPIAPAPAPAAPAPSHSYPNLKALQAGLGIAADGVYGPASDEAVGNLVEAVRLLFDLGREP
jgi:lysozyme